jgi:hypothetical protein
LLCDSIAMPTPTSRSVITGLAAAGALASSLVAQPASACGGFFCNNSQPVNQAAERILFAVGDDGTVTATIQILYSGEADSFAWVLPVAGSPEVRVSSNLAFARLQAATNPSYVLTTTVEGTCSDMFRGGGPTFNSGGGFSDAAAAADAGGPPVTVVNEGSVGPYDFVVIALDPGAEDVTAVAVDWLHDNDYQIDEAGAERIAPYLMGGMNLLAFRLTKGNDTGSIRPVEITFGTGAPAVPIRPTAVAAVEDMGVMVWVLGRSRSIPVNYMSLELNEALINWMSPAANYNDVVVEAANQAGGQGFVTEFAGDAETFATTLLPTSEAAQWDGMRATDWTGRDLELLTSVVYGGIGQYDGVRDAIAANVTLPEGRTVADVLACPSCVFPDADIPGFEPAAFLGALEDQAIEPMERTAALFVDHDHLTRFYTTMSADEMTRDPVFDFNPNLPDVSNVHNATRIIECSPSISQFEAPWRVVLPSGETVRGRGNSWPFTASDGTMPANARIRRLDTEGEGEVVVDNVAAVSAALTAHNDTVPRVRYPGGGGACHVGRSGGTSALGALVLAGLAVIVARRRR